jgi:hypothetical protein
VASPAGEGIRDRAHDRGGDTVYLDRNPDAVNTEIMRNAIVGADEALIEAARRKVCERPSLP